MEPLLEEIIEALRLEMVEEASVQGNLSHQKVVELSQKLDRYIIIYQRLKAKRLTQTNDNEWVVVRAYSNLTNEAGGAKKYTIVLHKEQWYS